MISLSTNVAIVKIEGDVLTICFSPSGQRQAPAQFVSPAGSGITLWQGTRVK